MKKAILVAILFASSISHAQFETNTMSHAMGNSKDNGGQGVQVLDSSGNTKVFSYDLFESGLHQDPYFRPGIEVDSEFFSRVEKTLHREMPVHWVTHKLTELKAISKVHAYILLKTMELLRWRIVPGELTPTTDGKRSPIDQSKLNMQQLAVRTDGVIRIRKDLWNLMDPGNQTALIFHEVLYTWIGSNALNLRNEISAAITRDAVAFLFSREIETQGFTGWKRTFPPQYDLPPYGWEFPKSLVADHESHTDSYLFVNPWIDVEVYELGTGERISGFRVHGESVDEGWRERLRDYSKNHIIAATYRAGELIQLLPNGSTLDGRKANIGKPILLGIALPAFRPGSDTLFSNWISELEARSKIWFRQFK